MAKLQWSHLAQTLAELAVDLLGPNGLLAKGGPDAVDGGIVDPALQLPALHVDRRRARPRCRRTSSPTAPCSPASSAPTAVDMKLGIVTPVVTRLPRRTRAWEADAGIAEIERVVLEAERLGYHHVTCSEHVAIPTEIAERRGGTYWDPLAVVRLPRGAHHRHPLRRRSSSSSGTTIRSRS